MKRECFLKILAVIFATGILFSLWNMHHDLLVPRRVNVHEHLIYQSETYQVMDTVFIRPARAVGVIETITNETYHVVYRDGMNNSIHEVFNKNQLRKVLTLEHFHK